MKRISFLVLSLLLGVITSEACTSFLIGKNASKDGSVMITYSMDSFGMFTHLNHFPAADHPVGTMRRIVDGDTNHYMGEILEAPHTYAVMGNINEHQLAIMETTFGGREELVDTTGIIDYVSLMTLGLQRAKTAREAIQVMTQLVEQYGYASSGESFSIADPNEAWILEMIGKGGKEKGAVWVAVRIPDDAIACHANQSRIHQFDLNDKENVIASKDVISFARKMGFFKGKDKDFSFANAYAPADFSAIRFCEARVWSFYNKWVEGMDKYLEYAKGYAIDKETPMPLYFKPKQQLSLKDVMNSMRDHYEGTFFDTQNDLSAGTFDMPYRPSPLTWEYEGKKYFNERPISTQQTGWVIVAQMREQLPNAIGGVLWFGCDDANMTVFTPVYCCTNVVPQCYSRVDGADYITFSWRSAFWIMNWVANMVYPRYDVMIGDVRATQQSLEGTLATAQKGIESAALELYEKNADEAKAFLTRYTNSAAQSTIDAWRSLGEYLVVKYSDGVVRRTDAQGRFQRNDIGQPASPIRPGYPESFLKEYIKATGDRYKVVK
jgi:dipeptidase